MLHDTGPAQAYTYISTKSSATVEVDCPISPITTHNRHFTFRKFSAGVIGVFRRKSPDSDNEGQLDFLRYSVGRSVSLSLSFFFLMRFFLLPFVWAVQGLDSVGHSRGLELAFDIILGCYTPLPSLLLQAMAIDGGFRPGRS